MENTVFMNKVVNEAQVRSFMTYTFSKRQYRLFRKWFFKKARRYLKWDRSTSNKQWIKFTTAFNIKIEDDNS